MKYSSEIILDLPLERVGELFGDPDNMPHWQEGFVEMEHLQGKPGAEGAKSRMKYQMGKRTVEMVETILKNDLPHRFDATYEAPKVYNKLENYFEALPDGRTKWTSENEFQFSGFMKLFGVLMPGAFKRQSKKYMVDFKKFAEGA